MIYDKDIDINLKNLLAEVKEKRDNAPKKSEEKKYYRNISKKLDSTLKTINNKNKDE